MAVHTHSVRKNSTFFLQRQQFSTYTSWQERDFKAYHASVAISGVTQSFDRLGTRVFTQQEILRVIGKHRAEWHILDRVAPKKILDYLLIALPLRKLILEGSHHTQEFHRYLWREAQPLEVAASVRAPSSYLCHSSALFVHRLVEELPKDLYVNYEQTPKPKGVGELTQTALDQAFQGRQRQSAFTFRYKKHVIVVLSGKSTGGLEVEQLSVSRTAKARVTGLERTLIDVTVRPTYAGGVSNVLDAFRRAQDRVSIDKLLSTLQRLDYLYPFHQAIGFYMERASYPEHHLVKVRALGMSLDFYLAHAMRKTAYDKTWKLYYPGDL